MRYTQPNPPNRYLVKKTQYSCKTCEELFFVLSSCDNDIVKYVEPKNGEERWLPTYDSGGYLDLITKLVSGFSDSQQITMAISQKFEKAFSSLQEPASSGNVFELYVRPNCPKCYSTDLNFVSEQVLDSPSLKWMKYSTKLLD